MSTPQNDAFQIRAPKPIDSRYLKNEIIPWVTTTEVNAAINSAYRYPGLTVLIGTQEYWYLNGITDSDLVPKAGGNNSITVNLSADGFYTFSNPGGSLMIAMVVTPATAITFKAGTSPGANDVVYDLPLAGSIPAAIIVTLWRNPGQSIYFSGISGSSATVIIKTI
jgi:hypothetical protein